MARRKRQKRAQGTKRKQTQPGTTIGEQVFAAVEKLTAGGAMTRSAAFKQVAKERKSTAGTVSVNFYRIANQKGVKLRRRRARSGAASPGRPASSPGRIKALLDQLADPGRMLIPVGDREKQELILVEREGGETRERPVPRPTGQGISFVPLLGRFAWESEG